MTGRRARGASAPPAPPAPFTASLTLFALLIAAATCLPSGVGAAAAAAAEIPNQQADLLALFASACASTEDLRTLPQPFQEACAAAAATPTAAPCASFLTASLSSNARPRGARGVTDSVTSMADFLTLHCGSICKFEDTGRVECRIQDQSKHNLVSDDSLCEETFKAFIQQYATNVTIGNSADDYLEVSFFKFFKTTAPLVTALFLEGNIIPEVMNSAVHVFPNMTSYDISFNFVTNLPEGSFLSIENLSNLDLSDNQVSMIPEDLFSTLTSITRLDLNNNDLLALPESPFTALTNLEKLYIYGNHISYLSPIIFNSLSNLRTLDISRNEITSISASLFKSLTNLSSLRVGYNRISSLDANIFRYLTNLIELNLDSNGITSFPQGIFDALTQLQILSFSSNAITMLPSNLLTIHTQLAELYFAFNAISKLPTNAFAVHRMLKVLDMSSNHISALPGSLLSTLTSLEQLSIASNFLTEIPIGLFDTLTALKNVSLSYNRITSVPTPTFANNPNLVGLYMRENRITDLPLGVFDALSNLVVLSLEYNHIASVDPHLFAMLTSLKILELYANAITELSPGLFDTTALLEVIDIYENRISSLPPGIFDALDYLNDLDVSSNLLTALPPRIFDNLTRLTGLWLTSNHITSLPAGIFDNLSAITILDFSDNAISVIPPDCFHSLSRLTFLNISALHISSFPDLGSKYRLQFLDASSNNITSLPVLPVRVEYLNISNNAFFTMSQEEFHTMKVRTLDVSNTSVQLSNLACTWEASEHRLTLLQAKEMNHVEDQDRFETFVTSCLPFIDLLDISSNFVDNLRFLERSLKKIEFIVPVTKDDVSGENKTSQLQLGTQSSVQCSLEISSGYRSYKDGYVYSLPVLSYDCLCGAGFIEDSEGVCVPRPPFWTNRRVAGMVIGTIIVCFGIVAFVRYSMVKHKQVTKNLELTRHLLEDQEDFLDVLKNDVAALKRGWNINEDELVLEARLSEGGYGEVWRANWEGTTVAVKFLLDRVSMDEMALEDFKKEAEFLQRTRHKNLVRFYGTGLKRDGSPFVVVEYMVRGSLQGLLGSDGETPTRPLVPWSRKMSFCVDITRGMSFIHGLGQMHRDLKTANVLITSNFTAKIADFGTIRWDEGRIRAHNKHGEGRNSHVGTPSLSSRESSHLHLSSSLGSDSDSTFSSMAKTRGVGTPTYMAPEILRSGDYTFTADVWSFGVMLWEIVSQDPPDLLAQEGKTRGPPVGSLIMLFGQGKRLKIPDEWPAALRTTILRCWDSAPHLRPSFPELTALFEAELKSAVGLAAGGVAAVSQMEV